MIIYQDGETALMVAAKDGKQRMVELLMNRGADPSEQDNVMLDILDACKRHDGFGLDP